MNIDTRYSELVDLKARNALVLKDGVIFNTRYEGDPKAGAVKVHKYGAAVVSDYNKATGVSATTPDDDYITITINKDKAVNEILDGYDIDAVNADVIADRLDAAGYSLANVLDADGAAELVANGTTLENTTALTKSTIYNAIVDVRTALSEAGVPATGRWLLVTPAVYALLIKCDEFVKSSALGDAVVQTGAVGSIVGFLVFESNNLGNGVEFIAGHPNYATRVNEWAVPVHEQDLNGSGKYIGAVGIQGRKVYGHKVTNANAILVKTRNF